MDEKNFTMSLSVNGKPEMLNFMLLYIILRHMFCIDLLNSLIRSGGAALANAQSIKYLHASLQATLQLMFINTTPKKMVKQQNMLFGEKAGEIWDMKNKDVIWCQSDYDSHVLLSKKVVEKKENLVKEGGGEKNVDVIHGNFVKIFMQKLSTSLITNIKESQTSAPPKQSELLLHNDQIYNDIKTTITSFCLTCYLLTLLLTQHRMVALTRRHLQLGRQHLEWML